VVRDWIMAKPKYAIYLRKATKNMEELFVGGVRSVYKEYNIPIK